MLVVGSVVVLGGGGLKGALLRATYRCPAGGLDLLGKVLEVGLELGQGDVGCFFLVVVAELNLQLSVRAYHHKCRQINVVTHLNRHNNIVRLRIGLDLVNDLLPVSPVHKRHRRRAALGDVGPLGRALEERDEARAPAAVDGRGGVAGEDKGRREGAAGRALADYVLLVEAGSWAAGHDGEQGEQRHDGGAEHGC